MANWASDPDLIAEFHRMKKKVPPLIPSQLHTLPLPDALDLREKGLFTPIHQGSCGHCWAIAATSALQDRFRLQGIPLELSERFSIVCSFSKAEDSKLVSLYSRKKMMAPQDWKRVMDTIQPIGCAGNTLSSAWNFLYHMGTVDLRHVKNPIAKTCMDFLGTDVLSMNAKKYRARMIYRIPGTSSDNGSEWMMREDLLRYGPITAGFMLHADFEPFFKQNPGGIYHWDQSSPELTGHAIVLVGWGTDRGQDYWICRNSWGPEWNDAGYFRIRRGVNECLLEENAMAGLPDIPGVEYPGLSFSNEDTDDEDSRRQSVLGSVTVTPSPRKKRGIPGWVLLSIVLALLVVVFSCLEL